MSNPFVDDAAEEEKFTAKPPMSGSVYPLHEEGSTQVTFASSDGKSDPCAIDVLTQLSEYPIVPLGCELTGFKCLGYLVKNTQNFDTITLQKDKYGEYVKCSNPVTVRDPFFCNNVNHKLGVNAFLGCNESEVVEKYTEVPDCLENADVECLRDSFVDIIEEGVKTVKAHLASQRIKKRQSHVAKQAAKAPKLEKLANDTATAESDLQKLKAKRDSDSSSVSRSRSRSPAPVSRKNQKILKQIREEESEVTSGVDIQAHSVGTQSAVSQSRRFQRAGFKIRLIQQQERAAKHACNTLKLQDVINDQTSRILELQKELESVGHAQTNALSAEVKAQQETIKKLEEQLKAKDKKSSKKGATASEPTATNES
ncbi:hypothetical protein CYMTET_10468 [Cymbomonas tetramitiformis]|uniref:Uncharacterized protein n=1 Tax=Cymbomonas tetramitiformis TaxID=36881 RepID=A0AAE0GPC8_9CHLO|nr:hypothetical protein CYMTET_10468 [Cymbomonas tetramitiformis]